MTFKLIIKVIGYVNKLCGGFGMLVRWAQSMFTQCKYH